MEKKFTMKKILFFKGEYLNGKRTGKGMEYFFNGNISYKGEYLNDKKHGKGQEFNENGELIFDGEYLFNYKIRGTGYVKGKKEYEGEYFYNMKYNGKRIWWKWKYNIWIKKWEWKS